MLALESKRLNVFYCMFFDILDQRGLNFFLRRAETETYWWAQTHGSTCSTSERQETEKRVFSLTYKCYLYLSFGFLLEYFALTEIFFSFHLFLLSYTGVNWLPYK